MEDDLMYTRNLNEGDEAVIGCDGGIYPSGMLCDEELSDDMDTFKRQNEWFENYLDAVEEMNQ